MSSVSHRGVTPRGAPPSTVTAALQRLEAELSIPLVRRSGGKLAFSIQSEQMRSALTRLATLCCRVYGQPPDQAIRAAQERPVTLEAVWRAFGGTLQDVRDLWR